jgi:hypothetical protein
MHDRSTHGTEFARRIEKLPVSGTHGMGRSGGRNARPPQFDVRRNDACFTFQENLPGLRHILALERHIPGLGHHIANANTRRYQLADICAAPDVQRLIDLGGAGSWQVGRQQLGYETPSQTQWFDILGPKYASEFRRVSDV